MSKSDAPLMHMVPLQAVHFRQVKMTEHEAPHAGGFTDAQYREMEGPYSTTVMLDAVPILLIGAWQLWEHRAHIWHFLSVDATAERFGELLGLVRAFLDGLPYRRLESSVEVGFLPGHQWVKSLGFTLEAPLMRAFLANGQDCALYSRIKEDTSNG